MTTIIAIDPGKKGGYCICLPVPGYAYNFTTLSEFIEEVTMQIEEVGDVVIVLEDPPPYAGKNIPSHTAFKLGRYVGQFEGVAQSLGLSLHLVSPRTWQKGIPGLTGLQGSPRKRALKEHATRLYPKLKPTLNTCDAILIGHWFYHFQPNK